MRRGCRRFFVSQTIEEGKMTDSFENNRARLLADGYKEYTGEHLNVYFKREVCRHASKCVHGDPYVFNLERKPWIEADNGEAAKIKSIIDSCPSGALRYLEK